MQQVEDISKLLKHQRNMKKIKKECLKSMVAGPSLIDEANLKPSQLKKQGLKKDSIVSSKSHKNSLVGPAYNSDSEDFKQQHETKVEKVR